MELTQLIPDTPMEVWDTLTSDTDTLDSDTDMEDFTTRSKLPTLRLTRISPPLFKLF